MNVIGNPYGPAFTLVAEDGSRLVLTPTDNGVNLQTPGSTSGWDLAHVAEVPGEPDALMVAGRKFRAADA